MRLVDYFFSKISRVAYGIPKETSESLNMTPITILANLRTLVKHKIVVILERQAKFYRSDWLKALGGKPDCTLFEIRTPQSNRLPEYLRGE